MGYDAQVPGLARRRRRAATSQDYTVEVNEGEVVLDIIHRLQATQAPRPRRALELQGRQVRLVQRRDQRQAAADVHDPDDRRSTEDETDHRHPDAHLPGDPRPRHRRLVQLREGPRGAGVRAAGRPRAGRLPDAAGRRRALAGVPQVHRVLPVPEHLPRRSATTRRTSRRSPGPRFLMRIAELDMHPLDTVDRRQARRRGARPRLLQHHQVLHRGLPRAHQDHRQRDHPDEGARRRRQVRPARWLGKIGRRTGHEPPSHRRGDRRAAGNLPGWSGDGSGRPRPTPPHVPRAGSASSRPSATPPSTWTTTRTSTSGGGPSRSGSRRTRRAARPSWTSSSPTGSRPPRTPRAP